MVAVVPIAMFIPPPSELLLKPLVLLPRTKLFDIVITEVPAKILGIDDRSGKIKKGYNADLALFSGHPLDIRSRLEAIMIDGDLFTFVDGL